MSERLDQLWVEYDDVAESWQNVKSAKREDERNAARRAIENEAAAGYGLVEPWRASLAWAMAEVGIHVDPEKQNSSWRRAYANSLALLTEPDTATDKGS